MKALLLFLCLLTANAVAGIVSADNPGVKGSFWVSVNDAATIYVNGVGVFAAGRGESKSPELRLSAHDRVVVQLRADGIVRRFKLVFASSDGKTVASFRSANFRVSPAFNTKDFTRREFENWDVSAFVEKTTEPSLLAVRNRSDWVWGQSRNSLIKLVFWRRSTLACVIDEWMFTPVSK